MTAHSSPVPLLAVVLVAMSTGCTDTPDVLDLPPDDDSPPQVIVALLQHLPWLGGPDRPLFLLYSDGTVIYPDSMNGPVPASYHVATLPTPLNEAIRELGIQSDVMTLDSLYDYAPFVTDQHNLYLLVWIGNGPKSVRLRAALGAGRFLRPDVPRPFRRVYRALRNFSRDDSRPWVPDSLEVSVWPYEYAPDDPPLAWPANWPTLDSSAAQRHDDRLVGELWTIGMPHTTRRTLDSLLGVRGDRQAVQVSERKWAISYRLRFPDEARWRDSLELAAW